MARRLSFLVPVLLVFVFAFTLAVSTHSPAEANACCRLINHCPDGTKLYGWGVWNAYHVCVKQMPITTCNPPKNCLIP